MNRSDRLALAVAILEREGAVAGNPICTIDDAIEFLLFCKDRHEQCARDEEYVADYDQAYRAVIPDFDMRNREEMLVVRYAEVVRLLRR